MTHTYIAGRFSYILPPNIKVIANTCMYINAGTRGVLFTGRNVTLGDLDVAAGGILLNMFQCGLLMLT